MCHICSLSLHIGLHHLRLAVNGGLTLFLLHYFLNCASKLGLQCRSLLWSLALRSLGLHIGLHHLRLAVNGGLTFFLLHCFFNCASKLGF